MPPSIVQVADHNHRNQHPYTEVEVVSELGLFAVETVVVAEIAVVDDTGQMDW